MPVNHAAAYFCCAGLPNEGATRRVIPWLAKAEQLGAGLQTQALRHTHYSSRSDTVHPRARSLVHGGHTICHLNLQIYMDIRHRDPKTAIIKFIHLKCLKTQSGYS